MTTEPAKTTPLSSVDVGVRFSPDIYEALQAHTKDLANKGDPMLTEASVVRAMTVECLRRAGKLKTGGR